MTRAGFCDDESSVLHSRVSVQALIWDVEIATQEM